jgi:ATP-dependent protease HslVU (ClpYQ) peptidase subunit
MAVKRGGDVWLGSDTRITYGNDFKIDCAIEHDSKLVVMKNAIIGAAGDITMRNYLELFISKGDNRESPFETKLDVIEFFIRFKKFLKRHAGLGESMLNQVQNLDNTVWLVATKSKVFEYDQDGGIVEIADVCVIGSGGTSARAVLDYIFEHQPTLSVPKAMVRAHDIAVKNTLSCGGPQIQVNVTKLLS